MKGQCMKRFRPVNTYFCDRDFKCIRKPVIKFCFSLVGLVPYSVTAALVTKYSVSGSKFGIKKLVFEVMKL